MRALAALAVTVALLGCDSRSPTSPGPAAPAGPLQIHVTGRVIDFQTGLGAADRELQWTGTSVDRTITGSDGRYKILLSPADHYGVDVGASNVIVPGTGYVTDFYVNEGYCRIWYGVVFDASTRRPVADARVYHMGANSLTGPDGVFRVEFGCGERPDWSGSTAFQVIKAGYRDYFQLAGRAEWIRFTGYNRRMDVLLVPAAP